MQTKGPKMEELELIKRSLDGEMEAWGEIVKRYKKAVFGISIGILGNAADAEDVTQDAFIKAYENLSRYDLSKRFSTWIFTIASNICKNKLRRGRVMGRLRDASQLSGGADPAEEVAREERSQVIRDSLSQLSYKYKAPLVLRYYKDLGYKEIAEILRIPEGTVKTRIHRGKAELKRILEKKGVNGYD